ncbi:MAG: transcriptional regulator [Deltaproteobacteria bacterium]|nr:transcriptional regulator [Deltaproteobacteria bacterium]
MAELELAVGDRVVYPGQGVCKVSAITEKILAGEKLVVVALAREEDGAQVLVPKTKIQSVGVRKLAAKDDVVKVFEYLKGASDDPELDWKVRHRAHQDKVALGGLMGLAEVVKSLQILSELRPLPAKERERYDNARHLLVREIAIALDAPEVNAEDAIDLALIPLGGVKKPRAVPLADALGGDDDLELGGDLAGMDLGDMSEPEEQAEEAEEAEEAGEEAEGEEAEEKPKKPAKAPKAPKAPKEKKPKEPKAAKPPKEPKPKPAKEAKPKAAAKKPAAKKK